MDSFISSSATCPDEEGPVCVAGEAYRKRPPEPKGWRRPAAMRHHGPTGVPEVFGDGGDPLGDVTAAGAGPYRIRAYVRGVERAPGSAKAKAVKEVLILTFPASPSWLLFITGFVIGSAGHR